MLRNRSNSKGWSKGRKGNKETELHRWVNREISVTTVVHGIENVIGGKIV